MRTPLGPARTAQGRPPPPATPPGRTMALDQCLRPHIAPFHGLLSGQVLAVQRETLDL